MKKTLLFLPPLLTALLLLHCAASSHNSGIPSSQPTVKLLQIKKITGDLLLVHKDPETIIRIGDEFNIWRIKSHNREVPFIVTIGTARVIEMKGNEVVLKVLRKFANVKITENDKVFYKK